MNKKTITLALCLVSATTLMAQNQPGGISSVMLQKIETLQKSSPAERALANAFASNNIDDLARNHAHQGALNTYFSDETPKQSIQNQESSGRCWMFSGLNVLRGNFAKAHNDTLAVEFSHAYIFFYDQLEKANLMLQAVIDNAELPMEDARVQFFFKNPINDGGTFCGVADLAEKYGLVPKSVQPETYSSDNTKIMAKLVSRKLREFGLELRKLVAERKSKTAVNDRKTEMLSTIYHLLTLTLGEPVKTFTYVFTDKNGKAIGESKQYTPRSFYDVTVGHPLNGTFLMVMNDPRHPYYKTYEVQYDRHTYDGHNWTYLNLPMDEIAQLAIASIKDGHKMYSSYDVGKQLDLDNYDYASLTGTTYNMNKADRIRTFDSGSTHAMTLTAVDLDRQGKPVKWKVENSWGPSYGHQGYLIMTNRWFNEFMFRLVVDRKYASEKVLKAAQQKPIMLLQDDPLFQDDK